MRRLSGRQEMVDHPANLRLERGRPREIAGGFADGRARQQHLRLRGLVRSGPSLVRTGGRETRGGPDHFVGATGGRIQLGALWQVEVVISQLESQLARERDQAANAATQARSKISQLEAQLGPLRDKDESLRAAHQVWRVSVTGQMCLWLVGSCAVHGKYKMVCLLR